MHNICSNDLTYLEIWKCPVLHLNYIILPFQCSLHECGSLGAERTGCLCRSVWSPESVTCVTHIITKGAESQHIQSNIGQGSVSGNALTLCVCVCTHLPVLGSNKLGYM